MTPSGTREKQRLFLSQVCEYVWRILAPKFVIKSKGKKIQMAPSTMMISPSTTTTTPRSSTSATKKKTKISSLPSSSFQKNEQSSSSPAVVVFPRVSRIASSSSTTVVAAALLTLMHANATIAPCEAAQVVDWLTSGAEASPEELMRIMKESAKEDWDPTRVAPRVKDDDEQKTRKEEEASSDDVWEKNINANQFGMNREDLSADGYDIEAPIVSSDTFGRLGKFGAILIGADFVTAFIMGKSVLGVAKGLEKGEGEKRDWKESAAEMVMDKLKAKAEALKEQEGKMGETDEEKEEES